MPTGYTEIINDKPDLTLKEFVLRCATAFGYCIHQRDDAIRVVRKAEVDSYYIERRDTAQKQLEEFLSIPKDKMIKKLEKEIKKINADEKTRLKTRGNEMRQMKRNYDTMLKKVKKWNPPTIEHVNLKNFMIQQIEMSISYDIHDYSSLYSDIITESPEEYYETRLRELNDEYQRVKSKYEAELRKVEESNRWIDQLHKSL